MNLAMELTALLRDIAAYSRRLNAVQSAQCKALDQQSGAAFLFACLFVCLKRSRPAWNFFDMLYAMTKRARAFAQGDTAPKNGTG
jgi:hypothetical protein